MRCGSTDATTASVTSSRIDSDARLIEGDRYARDACRYVVDNPVRARLCRTRADWRWSGVSAL
jgi:hypothetical protein